MEYEEYEQDVEAVDNEYAEPLATKAYYETPFETACVRFCGGCCCVLLAVCTLTWVVHAIPIATVTDIPPFARSALWLSIAHHTEAWQSYRGSVSPPPPRFGDGNGYFPDT